MLVLTYWVLLWPHICRSSLAKNDLHTKSDESVKTAYNISFRYYNSPHSHQWESCLVRMIVLPHLYLNHQYGMCSSSTFVKFWKKIVHNVFKHCACGICISLYLYFNQVLPRPVFTSPSCICVEQPCPYSYHLDQLSCFSIFCCFLSHKWL